jgi:hypothetical protein
MIGKRMGNLDNQFPFWLNNCFRRHFSDDVEGRVERGIGFVDDI